MSKWTSGVTKLSPKSPESGKNQQHVIQGTRNGAPGATLELKVPTNAKQTQKTHPNSKKHTPESAPRSQTKKKNHMTTNSQPTNQRKKEGHKETSNRTNTHTRTRASNCKHKLKLPRPGARRRRRRSATVRSAPLAGVLGSRVEKPRLKSLFLLRTDKVNSLGACTHQPFLKVTRTLVKAHF